MHKPSIHPQATIVEARRRKLERHVVNDNFSVFERIRRFEPSEIHREDLREIVPSHHVDRQ